MKLLIVLTLFCMSEAYKILVVFPMPGKSHAILGEGVVDTLSKAGHEVTFITPFPNKKVPANVREVNISSVMDAMPSDDIMNIRTMSESPFRVHMAAFMGPGLVKLAISHENVQKLLRDPNEKFDLVVAEWFYSSLLSGFSTVFQAPFIWVSSMEPHWQVLELIDEATNPAYTASVLTKALPPFGFWDRVCELYMQIYVKTLMTISSYLLERPAYKEFYGPAAQIRGNVLPSYSDVAYNGSFMFFNGQPILSSAYRLPQNSKYVGGYHIDPDTKPLPEDLKKIFDNAKHGVIYFSMGSNLKSKDMHESTKRGLVKLFGELKQTVVWKFEEELSDLPKNLHILKWAPQPSILSHPNTVLFITHGGKLSTTEAIHYGIPVVGIPIFGDQFANMDQAVAKGYGIKVDYAEDLATPLKPALQEMLRNPSYAEEAKRISKIYHDQVLSPRKEMLHWVEYVIRHQGAKHLSSIALTVPCYQKIYLDLILILAVLLYVVRNLLRFVCNKCCSKSKKTVKDSKKRN